MKPEIIYYLPGHGGHLEAGLGAALLSRGYDVTGRQTLGEFKDIPFSEQVAIIAEDLSSHFWGKEALVIANSFGAYLFLHAQTHMKPFIGKVLLLSPIIGEFTAEDVQTSFIPPRAGQLQRLALEGSFPKPERCEIHVGELDWQSIPSNVQKFAALVGLAVTVVPGDGHMLSKPYVSALLDRWLGESKSDVLKLS
jgi:alpha-beta hydrolase superfamily lysophospholipase